MKISIRGHTIDHNKTVRDNLNLLEADAEGCEVKSYDYRGKTISLEFGDVKHIIPAASLIIAISALYGQEYVSSALR